MCSPGTESSIPEGAPNGRRKGKPQTESAMRDLNMSMLQYLQPFFLVAQTGSMRRAAAILFQTPSAVSHQIQKLEEALDAALFERQNGRPLTLTPAGKLLYDRIPSINNALFRLRSDLHSFRDLRPTLRIGVLPLIQEKLLRSIADYNRRCPNLNFSVSESVSIAHLCHEVLSKRLDCAVVFREHIPDALNAIPLFSAPMVLAVHPDLVRPFGRDPTWEQLATLPLVYICANRNTIDLDPFASLGLSGEIHMQVDSSHGAVAAIRAGLGAAVICTEALPLPCDDIVTFPLRNKKMRRHVALSLLSENALLPGQRDFISYLAGAWRSADAICPER